MKTYLHFSFVHPVFIPPHQLVTVEPVLMVVPLLLPLLLSNIVVDVDVDFRYMLDDCWGFEVGKLSHPSQLASFFTKAVFSLSDDPLTRRDRVDKPKLAESSPEFGKKHRMCE